MFNSTEYLQSKLLCLGKQWEFSCFVTFSAEEISMQTHSQNVRPSLCTDMLHFQCPYRTQWDEWNFQILLTALPEPEMVYSSYAKLCSWKIQGPETGEKVEPPCDMKTAWLFMSIPHTPVAPTDTSLKLCPITLPLHGNSEKHTSGANIQKTCIYLVVSFWQTLFIWIEGHSHCEKLQGEFFQKCASLACLRKTGLLESFPSIGKFSIGKLGYWAGNHFQGTQVIGQKMDEDVSQSHSSTQLCSAMGLADLRCLVTVRRSVSLTLCCVTCLPCLSIDGDSFTSPTLLQWFTCHFE